MAVWGYDQAATLAAMPLYRPEPVVPPSWSAWSLVTAVPRGIGEAAHQVVGSTADLAKAYRFFRDATPQQLRAGVPVEQYSSDFGDYVRDRGRALRPDPTTASAAEQVLYGFARGAAKVVGGAILGPVGVVAAGVEEGMSQSDELRRQGVGVEARTRAGVVQGAGLALAALPAFGATWGQTAALYVAGGPGGYVAQQAMTREILRTAGHERVAEQFDPLDPVGLTVASLLPAGFAWWGMRGQKLAAAAKSLPDLPRADAGAPAPDAAPFPSEPTAIARAVKLYPDEVVDAARVAYQAEVRSASDPGAGGMRTADAHEAALSRAEDQIARGDAVSVADVAPDVAAAFPAVEPPSAVGQGLRDFGGVAGAVRGSRFEDEFALIGGVPIRINYDLQSLGAARIQTLTPKQTEAGMPAVAAIELNPALIKAEADLTGITYRQAFDSVLAHELAHAKRAMLGRDVSTADGVGRAEAAADRMQQFVRDLAGASEALQGVKAPKPAAPITTAQLDDFFVRTKLHQPAAAPDVDAVSPARVAEVAAQFPDLMVRADDMAAPMRLADFLEAAKAEADEFAADADLMKIAAECALTTGMG